MDFLCVDLIHDVDIEQSLVIDNNLKHPFVVLIVDENRIDIAVVEVKFVMVVVNSGVRCWDMLAVVFGAVVDAVAVDIDRMKHVVVLDYALLVQ
jgi:hypothetical protein